MVSIEKPVGRAVEGRKVLVKQQEQQTLRIITVAKSDAGVIKYVSKTGCHNRYSVLPDSRPKTATIDTHIHSDNLDDILCWGADL